MISKRILYIAAVCITTMLVFAGCAAPKSPVPVEPPPGPVNNPPVISSLTADQQVVQPLGKVLLNCQASDPESDNLSYQWSASGGLVEGSADSASWTAPNIPGNYKVTVVVSDGRGGSGTVDALITVPTKPTNAPVISAIEFAREGRLTITIKTNPTAVEAAKTPTLGLKQWVDSAEITCLATDIDNDHLTYVWRATAGRITGAGPKVQWFAPAAGVHKITCEVSDGKGGTDSFTISVTVKCCG